MTTIKPVLKYPTRVIQPKQVEIVSPYNPPQHAIEAQQPLESNFCQELANNIVMPSGGIAVLAQGKCRCMELVFQLDNEVVAGDYFIFVWDYFATATSAQLSGSSVNDVPWKFPPKKINPGEVRNWFAQTKWTPFDAGILCGISSTDSSFTATEVGYQVYRHVVYNADGRR